jgi:heat shock protein HslJ
MKEMKHARASALLTIAKLSLMALVAIGVLAACSCVGATALGDTAWQLESLAGNDVLPDTTITLEFSDNEVSGSAGCNHYGGRYRAGKDSLKVSDLFWTEIGCLEPEGVMEQERAYLTALSGAAGYLIDDGRLEIVDETGTQTLVFVAPGSEAAAVKTPTPEQPSPVPPTPTPAPPTPTAEATENPPPPAFEPPAGFKQYQDSMTGISVYVPDSWVVTGVVPGQFAILQSYPEDKYPGGGGQHPGDTKCDLTIHPPEVSVADVVGQAGSNPDLTVVSEQEIVLQSGEPGIRREVVSMGPSISVYTEVNERAVVLTCFGEFALFDEIAGTLGAGE